ncbi:flagellar type III secretion system pore protein FliP [Pseudomonas aeruginosa]
MTLTLPRSRHNLVAGLIVLALTICAGTAQAAGIDAISSTPVAGGGQKWSLSVETLVMLSSLTLLPTIILMMTGFTRIIIVLGLLRNAMGTATTPPNQVLLGLALFLTLFIMSPVITKVNEQAWQPLQAGKINFEEFIERANKPMKEFMLHQTREADIARLAKMIDAPDMQGPEDVPMSILIPAFVVSEIKTGFMIGFMIYIPFVIIDLVVASVLMGLGMMMVPPVTVSLPLKLMLFVLADGWNLLIDAIAKSFYT